jgi:hypothetical protein
MRRSLLGALVLVLAFTATPRAAPADPPGLRLGMTTEPGSLSPLFALDDYSSTTTYRSRAKT